jgi:hypothetical protein
MEAGGIVEDGYCRIVNEAVEYSFAGNYDFNGIGNAQRMNDCTDRVKQYLGLLTQIDVTRLISTEQIPKQFQKNNGGAVAFTDFWPASEMNGIPYAQTVLDWFEANEQHRHQHEDKYSQTYAWNLNYTRICVMRFLLYMLQLQQQQQAIFYVNQVDAVRIILTELTSLCRYVKWVLDKQYMETVGWRYKPGSAWVWSDDYVRTRDLCASDRDAPDVPPKLLFFNNEGTMRMGRDLRKMEQPRWTIYKRIISEMVTQIFVPVHVGNTFLQAFAAEGLFQEILKQLELLKVCTPQYIIQREPRPFVRNRFRDIWPSSGKPFRGHKEFIFVNRVEWNILKSNAKLNASVKRLPIADNGNLRPCYSMAYVWNVEFLVVCLMRLLYHHLSQPQWNQTQADPFVQRLATILQISFRYWQCVRGVYLVQMDTTYKPLEPDGTSIGRLQYQEHVPPNQYTRRQYAGYPAVRVRA